jgi:transketolase
MAAPKFKLDNLTLIVDSNNGQIDGHVTEIMPLEPLADKLKSFNWDTRVIDGHDLGAIDAALAAVKAVKGQPQAIVAKTVKGKGVSFMENNIAWHGKAPNKQECELALKEILGA